MAAERESRRAVELSPGQSVTHAHLGDYLSIVGRNDEAVEQFHRVLDLDPISLEYHTWFALILYQARRYDESITHSKIVLDLDPHYTNALWFLALALEQKGEITEAIVRLEMAVSLSGAPHYRALSGRAFAITGERSRAIHIVDELIMLSSERYVSPFDIAIVYEGLGDQTPMFSWLEEAYQQGVSRTIELTLPLFDRQRTDPRWQNLVSRIGLSA